MISINKFYKQFEEIEKGDKFKIIDTPIEPSSLFVIFKQLAQVRAQKKYFEEREAHLLALAELGFKQLEDGKIE